MKIAVLGDIHGNLPALEAAYAAALKEGFDRIFHLGDLGGYAPFVNEVVEFMRSKGIEGVQGNYDRAVADDAPHCGCRYENPSQAAMAETSFLFTKARASEESRRFMRELPQTITLAAGGRRIMLFHAAPHKNNLYWYEDRPERFFREMGAKSGADVLIFGHTHRPFRRDLDGRVFINAGSVGKPKDGDPRACLALVTAHAGGVECEFVRAAYDLDAVAAAIVSNGLPPELALKLRSGA